MSYLIWSTYYCHKVSKFKAQKVNAYIIQIFVLKETVKVNWKKNDFS